MAKIDDINAFLKWVKSLDDQSFKKDDSVVVSTINHPIDAASKLSKWLAGRVNTAAGRPDQYDNKYPLLAPPPDAQTLAAIDVAGMAQLGSFPFAPKSAGGTVGTFIGPKSATWSKDKAAKAVQLLDEGVDPAQVWKEHLIGRMPDKTLFSEIDDNLANIIPTKGYQEWGSLNSKGNLPDVYDHNPLYNNYDLRDHYTQLNNTRLDGGQYIQGTPNIRPSIYASDRDIPQIKSTLSHEIQHAIQQIEGWARGGSPEQFKGDIQALNELNQFPFDDMDMFQQEMYKQLNSKYKGIKDPQEAYRRLTGEAQARATQDRLNMSLEERRNNYPLAGGKLSDIPLEQLIYKYGDNGPAMAIDAYHASPYKFDKFSLDKIGTGEGAQAYGKGIYVAENFDVADDYFREFKSNGNKDSSLYKLSLEWPDAANESANPLSKKHFFDYKKPAHKQSYYVQEALKKVREEYNNNSLGAFKSTDFNRSADDVLKLYGEQLLNKHGIPGIRYLDEGSRGVSGKKSYNYVVFDDKIPKIVERNGQGLIGKPDLLPDENLNKPLLEKYLNTGKLSPEELAQYEANAVQMTGSGKHHYNLANANAQGGTPESRAVDLGFDTPVYHGTNADIKEFDYNYTGNGNDQFGSGFYTDTRPHVASGYANGEGSAVYPLMVNVKKPLDSELEKTLTKKQITDIIKGSPNLDDALSNYGDVDYEGKAKVLRDAVNQNYEYQDDILLKNLHPLNNDFYRGNPERFSEVVKKATGYDSVKANFDDGQHIIPWQTNQIRSRFAAFDPLRKDSANILASILGGTMLANEYDKRKGAGLIGEPK